MVDIEEMELAAGDAEEDLKEQLDQMSALDLCQWWSKWYIKTGHKRLGRILVQIAKDSKK